MNKTGMASASKELSLLMCQEMGGLNRNKKLPSDGRTFDVL